MSFTYPGQTEPALKNINLVIEPGETLAIVGFNGGGKTTLVKVSGDNPTLVISLYAKKTRLSDWWLFAGADGPVRPHVWDTPHQLDPDSDVSAVHLARAYHCMFPRCVVRERRSPVSPPTEQLIEYGCDQTSRSTTSLSGRTLAGATTGAWTTRSY